MNILAYCQFEEGYHQAFREKVLEICPDATVDYFDDQPWDDNTYHEKLRQAELVIGHIPPDDLRYCEKLRAILLDIAGADMYMNCPYLAENVTLCSASGAYGVVLAEHAVSLVMALCRNIPGYYSNQQQRIWQKNMTDKPIEGSTVLILGAGDIGLNTARLLRPLAKRMIGVRRVRRETPEYFDEMISFQELDDYLPLADIISCSLPGTKETYHLLNSTRLRLMKKDAVLVNVGRGSLIPTDDLCEVLSEGHLHGVGLDVAEQEPLPPDSPLWSCDRLILTPHIAGNTITQDSPTNARIFEIIYHNLENYVHGRALDHVVDRKTGYRTTGETPN